MSKSASWSPKSRTKFLQSHGMDGTVHGILTCPILKYTSKSQCPVPSYSLVGWTGLSTGFSHVPSSSISPNPSVRSRPTVLWDGRDCPLDSHMSHPQVYPQIPVSRPVLQSCGMDGTVHEILTSHPQVYLQIPVSGPVLQSCGMDRTVHWILTCPILKYTPKSQCPVPSCSPVGWTGLSMGFSHVPSSSIPPNPSVLSHPTVLWDGRDCPWDSHVPSSSIPPNPSVPSRPTVLWDGRDCPWDSHVPSSSIPPNPSVPSRPTVLWDGRDCPWDSHMSHPQVYLQTPVSHPVPQSCGMDGTVHGILTCPILKYTSKSQCPIPSHSPVGWTGLSMGFSHVPSSSIPPNPSVPSHPTVLWDGRDCPWDSHVPSSSIPPNPSVPSRPTVLWDGRDCPWDSHMSHPQVYPQIPVSRPVLQSCGMDGTVHGILTSHPQVYLQIPVSHPVPQSCGMDGTVHGILASHPQVYLQIPVSHPVPQSCGMDGTVHGILTCPILKYTSKSQCPIPSHSPVGWTGLSMGFSHVPSSSIPPNPSVPSRPTVLWDGRDCPWDSHMSHPQVYLQIPVSHPVPQSCGMDGTVHGILTCPILKYTPKSQCPIPSYSPVGWMGLSMRFSRPILKYTSKSHCPVPSYSPVGWTGLSTGFSHVPSSSIPPNPSDPSHPTVLWDGRDCPWDSHMSHPQVYPQIPVSRPVLQSCGMDGTVHGILTCPILKYTSKSQCPVPSHSPVGWMELSMGFSCVPIAVFRARFVHCNEGIVVLLR